MADYTDSNCCGIKNISLSLNEDGSISASVTGLPGDVYAVMNSIMRVEDNAYTIDSRRIDGVNITISATSDINDSYAKIPKAAIFKTIPSDIYSLHMSGIISRSMQSPLEAPDSDVYIRWSDMYGTDGWTVREILKILHVDAEIPSNFNYHVYQLNVSRGSPIMSLLHNLLPIPGLVIERRHSRYYVSVADGHPGFRGNACQVIGASSKTKDYETVVAGTQGEPRYIIGEGGSNSSCNVTLEYNLVGGVWAITNTQQSAYDSTEAIDSMFE